MTNLNNQSGRSMIEMLGVLAIIGVLSVGGIAGYSKAMLKFKTNKTIDQIAMTVTNIRTLYAQQPDYDITTLEAYDMGVVDDAMLNATAGEGNTTVKNLKNAFGGAVYIEKAHSKAVGEGTSTGAFVMTFYGLPREACVNIATNDWGSNYSAGFLGIAVGTEENPSAVKNVGCYVSDPNASGTADTGVVAEANTACASDAGKTPMYVSTAADGCACTGNGCFVSLKFF